ncbi:8810_t:CDS:2 [Acaulospora morrowiae]|uniref:8810_t:CDS:1 n=1 Tax=Acaulospora morrowiae TaxID=94023 RepID=A0A9N9A5E4_9GLOM|nr:8810_t:CDS:2 [Acaulospora morrowiae]
MLKKLKRAKNKNKNITGKIPSELDIQSQGGRSWKAFMKKDDANTFEARGETSRWMKKHDKSLRDLNGSLKIVPNNADTLRCRGETYLSMKMYEDSLADLNKSLEIEPNNADTLRVRGLAYQTLKKYKESLEDLNRSLEIEKNVDTLRIRGETYQKMKRYECSLRDLNNAIEIEPNNVDTLKVRGVTYQMMKEYERSLTDLNKSLEIEPSNTSTLKTRGLTYQMMGKYNESLADLNRAIEIEQSNMNTPEPHASRDVHTSTEKFVNPTFIGDISSNHKSSSCPTVNTTEAFTENAPVSPLAFENELFPLITITNFSEYRQFIASSKLAIVQFYAKWCGLSKIIMSLFNDLSAEYKQHANFAKVDVDQAEDLANDAQLKYIPTFIFFKNGQEIDRIIDQKGDKLEKLIKLHVFETTEDTST